MAGTVYCDTHGDVDVAETESFGGVVVHKVDAWHVARTGAVIEMADGKPKLNADGSPVVTYAPIEPAPDVAPPEDSDG